MNFKSYLFDLEDLPIWSALYFRFDLQVLLFLRDIFGLIIKLLFCFGSFITTMQTVFHLKPFEIIAIQL